MTGHLCFGRWWPGALALQFCHGFAFLPTIPSQNTDECVLFSILSCHPVEGVAGATWISGGTSMETQASL